MLVMSDEVFWKIIPIITSCLTLCVVYANARFGIRNKQADLVIHFHKQFDELQKKRTELLTAVSERSGEIPSAWSEQRINVESEIFFDRFWTLQFDQYVAWYEGYLPTDLYVYWLFSRREEVQSPTSSWTISKNSLSTSISGLPSRWTHNKDSTSKLSIHVSAFLKLTEKLASKTSIDIDATLREFGPPSSRRKIRKLFGAY